MNPEAPTPGTAPAARMDSDPTYGAHGHPPVGPVV